MKKQVISACFISAISAPLKGGWHFGGNASPRPGDGVARGGKESPEVITQAEAEAELEARAIAELERMQRARDRKRRKVR